MFYILLVVVNVILYIVVNCLFLTHERRKMGDFHTNYRAIKDTWDLQSEE